MSHERIVKAIETRTRYLRNEADSGDEAGVVAQAAKIIELSARLLGAPDTEIAHLEPDQYTEIARLYGLRLAATGKGSVEAGDWPDILGADLFAQAVEGGYFGPKGTVPGLPYGDLTVKGVQVSGTDGTYTLYADGVVIATEDGGGDFDTVAFAKRHGYVI
jgi:hypothetical protein